MTVSAAVDADTEAGTATIAHTAASADSDYNGITIAPVTATETDNNQAPAFTSAATFPVAENAAAVGTVTATDDDASDSITGYAITGGADQALFSIDAGTGDLTFASAPNFEDPADVASTDPANDAGNNAYIVEVTATGGAGDRAQTVAQTLTVTVTDDETEAPSAPSAPTISGVTATGFTVTWTAPENAGPEITGYAVQYREGTSGTWTDAGHSGTGLTITLSGLTASTSYEVQVQATNDEGTGAWSDSATATTAAAGPGVTVSESALPVPEAGSATYTVVLDTAPTAAVAIAAVKGEGADADLTVSPATLTFTTGDWSTAQTVTVSAAADADTEAGTAKIEHTATSTDSAYNGITIAPVTATETDNNQAPAITSAATFPVAENVAAVGTVAATDDDASDSITGYAITGGADQALFSIDTTTGALTFKNAPNFEDPKDVASTDPANDAGNNAYIVVVSATSGAGDREMTADQTITVTVTDDETEAPSAPSAPTISGVTATGFTVTWTAPENAGPAITGYAVQYREGTSGTWTDAGHSGTTLTVAVTGLSPATEYEVQVQATNDEGTGAWSASATATTAAAPGVTVSESALPVPEAGSATYTVVLDAAPTAAVTILAAKAEGDDADLTVSPATLTFTTGDWSTAQTVTVSAAADADTEAGTATITHTATSTDSDYSGITIDPVTATETDNNQAPAFTSAATFPVAENATAVGTVAATDDDASDSITGYALTGGADQALFSIDAGTGDLTFKSAPNFEAPADVASSDPANAANNNEYVLVVQATSGANARAMTATQTITVTVTDVNEPPSAPDAPTISAETADGFTASWTAPENTGPAITDYAVQYRVSGDTAWTAASHSGTGLTVTLTGLTASTSYEVQVQATNAEGTGAWSASATATTAAAPGVTVSESALPVPEAGSATYTVVLDTAPTAAVTIAALKGEGDDADLTVSPATLTFTTGDWSTAQTVTVSAAADDDTAAGTATIAHTAASADSAYNGIAITIASVTATEVETPTVAITGAPAAVGSTDAFDVTVTFSAAVTGFDATDVTVTNGSATVSGSRTTYTASITPDGNGDITIGIGANVAEDAAGNGNQAALSVTVPWDSTAPTVTITGAPAAVGSTDAFDVTVTFSETVTGFDATDITVTNGSATVSGSGTTYTASITPDGQGDITIGIGANVAEDAVGNGNDAATDVTVTWDATAPTVAITGAPAVVGSTDAFDVTVTFSEAVTGFDATDLTVTNGSATVTGSGAVYTATITPDGQGDITIALDAEVAEDVVGNGNQAALSVTVSWDATAPTVTITGAPAVVGSTDAFDVTVTFSEAVTGFDATDLTVTNGTATVSGSGTTYTASITPDGQGDITIALDAEVAEDAAGNGNDAATSVTVPWDSTAPTVAITGAPAVVGSTATFDVTVTFSEAVTGFDAADVTVTNGSATVSGSGTTYTASITPDGNGDITIGIGANVAEDTAGQRQRCGDRCDGELGCDRTDSHHHRRAGRGGEHRRI